ncbi:MAG: FAD:protein FMN transferase [Polaribacter sp.]|nr:FAD:protein FMN transferase [Polaribacter sp.]
MKRYILLVFLSVLISCNQKNIDATVRLEGYIFGTTYHITYLSAQNNNYQKSIDSLFSLMNRSLSTYIPTSDISKINAGDTAVVVDALFEEVYQKSKRIYTETNGYFDPTVGFLVNAWGFGPEKAKKNMDSVAVQKMMQLVGFDKIQLEKGKIRKQDARIFLDFNSIAKGYGVDLIARFLESKNIQNYLVEIGGEIRASGKSSKQQHWRIAIEKPNTDGTQSFQKTIELSNQSMATSGNYRKFRISDEGKKYVHTVNPKTGFATESNLLSVSVISSLDCADVDAYATAFMAMGFEKTKLFVEKYPHLKVILIYTNATGELVAYSSK